MLQLVSILVCVVAGHCLDDSSLIARIPEIINHLCPGSNVCSNSRSSQIADDKADDISFQPGTESCCAECSCSAECSRSGNCCFPRTVSPKNNTTEMDFQTDHSCLYPMFPQPKTNQNLYQSFLMVSSVQNISRGSLGAPSNLSCGDMNVAPWGSLYPVYSAKSNKIYKNIECARDNGEDADMILWDAVINCQGENLTPDISIAATALDSESIPENCGVEFIFPGSIEVLQHLICYHNLIDTCSESHDFQVPTGTNVSKYDIRTLCTKSGFVSPYRERQMYANVFCHICNEVSYFRDNHCRQFTDGQIGKMGSGKGFVALIDDKFIAASRSTDNDRKNDLPTACSIENVNKCRLIFCPTEQLRNGSNKCVYPNKIWYNQNYAIYINLTLSTFINVSESFGIEYGRRYSTVLPPLTSVWLKKWSIETAYYRMMDKPDMSNNSIIITQRKLSSVKPDNFITNINKMIGKTWSLRLRNVTKVLNSAKFSKISSIWYYDGSKQVDGFYNLTDFLETPQYKLAYSPLSSYQNQHVINKLYICNQVELQSSEFLLSNDMRVLYCLTSKRFLFDGQFVIMHNEKIGESRARICVEDSGFHAREKNMAPRRKTFDIGFINACLVLTLLSRGMYIV